MDQSRIIQTQKKKEVRLCRLENFNVNMISLSDVISHPSAYILVRFQVC